MSANEEIYSIKEAARLCGLPESTLRYYESIGIIKPVKRGETSKYRVYTQQDLNILDTVSCLNATGMKLDDMKEYIANLADQEAHLDDQVALLRARLGVLDDEEQHMQLQKGYLKLKIEFWSAVKAGDDARVEEISQKSKGFAKDLKKYREDIA